MKYALRTRFGKDIVAQFMPPSRPTKRERVVILCDGMPTLPSKQSLLEFFSKKGYWVFHPRYRGSWESGGSFMKEAPDTDIGIVIGGLTRGFRDAWSGTAFKLSHPDIVLVGSSFGGATALLAGRDPRVRRVIAFSPLVDWTARSKDEPLDFLARFTRDGFGAAYRGTWATWAKLKKGTFFNPVRHAGEIDGSKVLIVHTRDDRSILWGPVVRFARRTKSRFVLLTRGGHMGLSTVMHPHHWKRVQKFLTMKP